MAKLIGLKASKLTPLMNGDLDCWVFVKLVAGQNGDKPASAPAAE